MPKPKLAHGQPKCCYCKRQLTPAQPERGTSFTLDHVRALSGGGYRRVPCCRACNQPKGNLDPSEWFWFIDNHPRWWKLFDTAAQVLEVVLAEARRRAYVNARALGIPTMKDAT